MSLIRASLLHVDAPAAGGVVVLGVVVDDIVTCHVRCFVRRNNLVKNASAFQHEKARMERNDFFGARYVA